MHLAIAIRTVAPFARWGFFHQFCDAEHSALIGDGEKLAIIEGRHGQKSQTAEQASARE
jgi:hypothetical protein